jgi:hypothetical protein
MLINKPIEVVLSQIGGSVLPGYTLVAHNEAWTHLKPSGFNPWTAHGNVCHLCGDRGDAKVCGGCMCVVYCSAECQKDHWSEHKGYCLSMAACHNGITEYHDQSRKRVHHYFSADKRDRLHSTYTESTEYAAWSPRINSALGVCPSDEDEGSEEEKKPYETRNQRRRRIKAAKRAKK